MRVLISRVLIPVCVAALLIGSAGCAKKNGTAPADQPPAPTAPMTAPSDTPPESTPPATTPETTPPPSSETPPPSDTTTPPPADR
jgi:hypothetical protein